MNDRWVMLYDKETGEESVMVHYDEDGEIDIMIDVKRIKKAEF